MSIGELDHETPVTQLDRLLTYWTKLGQGERNVLLTFTARLAAGQRKYGPLARDKKNWTYEALEEALDGAVYLSAALEAESARAYYAMVKDEEQSVTDAKTIKDPDAYYAELLRRAEDSGSGGV